ncbi:uncharacterized protein LOC141852525 isoform X2 [Brevipalpus obovatus]|uniref:uncharacterized protein LOC141852525 isoform X2 n=1 Tax=Brevipalpus obovatus TaxID=246614 RepID=UPI003D9DCA65
MAAFEEVHDIIDEQYCAAHLNAKGMWKPAFYCSNKPDGRKMFCCGTPVHKYCCDSKDGNKFTLFSSSPSVSSVTLFTAIVVTFVLAVMMTVVTFVCCRKFWKNRENALEIEESHSYRIAPGDSLHSPWETLDPERLQATMANGTGTLDTYLPLSSYHLDSNSFVFMEPPPPYQVNSSQSPNESHHNNNNNGTSNPSTSSRILAVIGAPYRRDVIYPSENRKKLWRTLSQ